jgi:hypothetical protein
MHSFAHDAGSGCHPPIATARARGTRPRAAAAASTPLEAEPCRLVEPIDTLKRHTSREQRRTVSAQ